MYRVEDYYKWEKLGQWKFVSDKEAITWINTKSIALTEKELGQAIKLLKSNCFPIALICYLHDSKITVLETPLWKGIFDFLANKRKVEDNGEPLLFEDMSICHKEEILNARIFSIWLQN